MMASRNLRILILSWALTSVLLISACAHEDVSLVEYDAEKLISIKDTVETGVHISEGDTLSKKNFIVNAVTRANGDVIAVRQGGAVVCITSSNKEKVLGTIDGTWDCRGLFLDSKDNVFLSPHSSIGTLDMTKRGIYKISAGTDSLRLVHLLYNPSSEIATEREENDDCIWTFCEDKSGNLYAGIYAHTKHANPAIYKSTDNGETWEYVYNFNTSGTTANGKHIHSIVYSPSQDALYAIVGEINEIYKSENGASTWKPLNIRLMNGKGSAMLAIQDGLVVGSDGAYALTMSKVLADDMTHFTTGIMWANTVFAIRQSDKTGWLYAFTKIDSSVKSDTYYPSEEADSLPSTLSAWMKGNNNHKQWQRYYEFVSQYFPEDAVRPYHFAILQSKDMGNSWSVIYREKVEEIGPGGFWTTGYFHNGKCLTGRYSSSYKVKRPLILSE